jgi:hypothetical protein
MLTVLVLLDLSSLLGNFMTVVVIQFCKPAQLSPMPLPDSGMPRRLSDSESAPSNISGALCVCGVCACVSGHDVTGGTRRTAESLRAQRMAPALRR